MLLVNSWDRQESEILVPAAIHLSILIFKYKHCFLQTAPHPFFCLAGKYCVIPLFAHIFFFFIVHNHHFQIKVIFSREIIFDYAVYISISLPYRKFNFPVNPHVCLMVGRLVCFLKGREVRLPCLYRSTCFSSVSILLQILSVIYKRMSSPPVLAISVSFLMSLFLIPIPAF